MPSSPNANAALHAHTPTLTAFDPRGITVRKVAFYRSPTTSRTEEAEPRIYRFAYHARNRQALQWDPRLWAMAEAGEIVVANTRTQTSLSGAVLRTESADAGWTIGLCGEAGQALQAWDSRGNTHRLNYDPAMRPVAVTEQLSGHAARVLERFTYGDASAAEAAHNRCGQLIRHDDPAGTRDLSDYALSGAVLTDTRRFLAGLDEPDWPEAVTERDALLEAESFTSCWRYGALGELRERTDAKGHAQHFTYSVAGHLQESALQWRGQSRVQRLVNDIRYNAIGQITARTAGNDVTSTYAYDPADGRLRQAQARKADGTPLQDVAYRYDPVGNVLRVEDATQPVRYHANRRSDGVSTYSYDTLYQLSEATGREMVGAMQGPDLPDLQVSPDPHALVPYTQTYAYDASGNLFQLQHIGDQRYTQKMVVAPGSNRCLPKPAIGLPDFAAGFDANGNVRELQPGQALSWDGRNRLQGVSPVTRELGPDDQERYIYDGGQQRIRKLHITQAQARTHVSEVRYLPGLELRSDTATGEVLQVISLSAGGVNVRALHWDSEPPAGLPNDQLRYTLDDHLGSSVQELDQDAQRISHEWYYPYGGTAAWSARSEIEASYKTIRYAGKERDATGLYYYGFRYYAPWLQRWLNPDPGGDVDGTNRYRFVGGNPMGYIDTSGLWVDVANNLKAAAWAFLRDTTGGTAQAALQFGVSQALQDMVSAPFNVALTAGGVVAGAIPGAYAGFGIMRSAAQAGGSGPSGQLLAGLSGVAFGSVIGALPSVIGHFDIKNAGYNKDAARQLATLVGAGLREFFQQGISNVGTSVEWEDGEASISGVTASAGVHAITLGVASFAKPVVHEALDKIGVGGVVAGMASATGSAVRGGWTGSKLKVPSEQDRNKWKKTDYKKVADAAMLRAAAGNAGHLLSKVIMPLLAPYLNADEIHGIVEAWAEKLPNEFRSLFKTALGEGTSGVNLAEAMGRAGSYDIPLEEVVVVPRNVVAQNPLNPLSPNFGVHPLRRGSIASIASTASTRSLAGMY